VARSLGENGLETLEVACDLTLQTGVIAAAIVLNEMRRLTEAVRPKALQSLPANIPALHLDVQADCSRYVSLRGGAMTIDRHAQLKALQLYGMAAAWQEWRVEFAAQHRSVMPEVWLDRLIAAEQADRHARRLSYQLV
jgi:hypothetical protein